jgi:hypothetical protein
MKIFIREKFSDQKTNNPASIAGLWKLYTRQWGTRNRKVQIEVKNPVLLLRGSPFHKCRIGDVTQTQFSVGESDHWGDSDIDGRIILRWIFRKWEGVVGTGWSWLGIGAGSGGL